MMRFLSVAIFVSVALAAASAAVTPETQRPFIQQGWLPGERPDEIPNRDAAAGARADTTWYGSYQVIEGEYYAVPGASKPDVMWTFDRGIGPFGDPERIENGEGWRAVDLTVDEETYFQVIDSTLDLGPGVPAPVLGGSFSIWVGGDEEHAGDLCWECGPGYGNGWRQRLTSETLPYSGEGDVTLSFRYWSFAEPCYDGTQVYLKRADGSELMLNRYPSGECADNPGYDGGTFTDSIGHYTAPETYTRVITVEEIGGAQEIRIVFEFTSDGGWSDEDCDFETIWGPFGVDDISITGGGIDAAYDFEDGTTQGWTAGTGEPVGDFAGIADVDCYTIPDPCGCDLSGNVLEMHAGECDDGYHPDRQHVLVESPICDFASAEPKRIFLELDIYADYQLDAGVLFRPAWRYWPWICEATGELGWSPRVAYTYDYYDWWNWPLCGSMRLSPTTVGIVPETAEKVIAIIELLSDCDAFTIEPCTGETDFSPIFDNIAVGVTEGVNAPIIGLEVGATFQDVGSYPSVLFDPRAPGPANVTRDKFMDTPPGTAKDKCGDSLVVRGPLPGSDPNSRWEAKLWWRVAKRGPFQVDWENGSIPTRYKIWKDRVADGKAIDRPDRPEFTWGRMDSVQVGFFASRDKFLSSFREDDDDFVGEGNEENEMIWDDILHPGTRIEYFLTSHYITTPGELSYLPDTSGGLFLEFEILPGLRTARVPDCGGAGFDYCVFQPATLYIDAYNRGAQIYIENALRTVLNGLEPCLDEEGCPIPKDRNWDRYDYLDATSNWNAPFVRGSVAGSNNGMTLNQILGYRTILVNAGPYGAGGMQDEDFLLFREWLISPDCNANVQRQVFVMNGDNTGELLEHPGGQGIEGHGPAFLSEILGAVLDCDAFNGVNGDPDCGEVNDSYCVRVLPAVGGPFGTDLDVDAYGNGCPSFSGFDVLLPAGTGIGNRFYRAEDGLKEMTYAQIVNEDLGSDANYRTAIDGVSWHHMTARDAGGVDDGLCPRDLPSIGAAGIAEIGAALRWGHDIPVNDSIPRLANARDLAECQDTWHLGGTGVDGENAGGIPIDRLYQNEPNPFSPATTIRFRLAQPGPVRILLYDVTGRLVKTLVDGKKEAGMHEVVWDGTNDLDRRVGAGVYWSQMKTGSYRSNKKIVVLN